MKSSKVLHMVAFLLTAIGGINWGLMGLGALTGLGFNDWNVVHMLFGSSMELEAIVYLLVGVSAVWILITHRKDCRMCSR